MMTKPLPRSFSRRCGLGMASSALTLCLVAAACGESSGSPAPFSTVDADAVASADTQGTTLTLVTHESFTVTDGIFDSFTATTGISVEVLGAGDAGEVVSRAVLAKGQPEGDVLFGIDNTFLQRGLDAGIFSAYESPMLEVVPAALQLDPQHRVTPIDYGDVCVNYWSDALPGEPPRNMDDLAMPENAASFVTENPETSSPGFAFLLATIATYGEDGWQDYWQRLADGGVTIESGWEEAYYGRFAAGGGPKALVTSYASSPVAEVIFADPPVDSPPTGVLVDSCFRQVEFAGILEGTDHPEAAAKLIDFLLSSEFQVDIPLNMFVVPANADVELPAEFVAFGVVVEEPLTLSPQEIEKNRSRWTEQWTDIVLR